LAAQITLANFSALIGDELVKIGWQAGRNREAPICKPQRPATRVFAHARNVISISDTNIRLCRTYHGI
jgi:hypothetical protein